MNQRLWEVDTARGLAVVLMVLFNWSFTLYFLDVFTIVDGGNWLYWWLFPRLIGGTFILIAGISLTLSLNKLKQRFPDKWQERMWRKYPARGLKIFGLGLGITAVTWIFYPQQYIFFGILHLIGLAIALATPLIDRPLLSLGSAVTIFVLTPVARGIEVSSRLLGSIGFGMTELVAFDYFSLLPWLGVLLAGVAVGHQLFPSGDRLFALPEPSHVPGIAQLIRWLKWLGQRSLVIYLAHQPVLIAVLLALGVNAI